jgi:GNAT superfamily N-acetyltransferase
LCWRESLTKLDLLNDGHDGHALHFVLFDQDIVVAAARLCIHNLLADVPDSHLFVGCNRLYAAPLACINRLVVSPNYRRLGIATIFDQVRTEVAKKLGCKTMLVSWNEHSGIQRRNAILAQGFASITDDEAVADGEWGASYPYTKSIGSGSSNRDEILRLYANPQILIEELNNLLPELSNRRKDIVT